MAVLWVLRRYGLSIGMCAEVLQECAKQSGAGAGLRGGGGGGVELPCVRMETEGGAKQGSPCGALRGDPRCHLSGPGH